MAKKKHIIYGITFVIFFLLIFFYGLNITRSNEKLNAQRLHDSLSYSESGIQKNLDYQAKFLQLTIKGYGIEQSQSMAQAEALVHHYSAHEDGYYLVDAQGVLRRENAPLAGKKIDRHLLTDARKNGYSVASMLDIPTATTSIFLVVALPTPWEGYLAQTYTSQEYIALSTENTGLSSSYLCLFDEWGNLVGTAGDLASVGNNEIVNTVLEGAVAYSITPQDNVLQELAGSRDHNLYFSASAPNGWFFGTRIEQQSINDAYFFNLPISSLFMLCILIFILLVVVTLDIINEQETKKKLATVSNIDHLTGLVNSVGMQDTMASFMRRHPMSDHAFVCLDIVAFSRINSMFGYSIGDMLLRVIAEVIQERYACGVRTNADCFAFLANCVECTPSEMEEQFNEAIKRRMGPEYLQMIGFKFGINPIRSSDAKFQDIYEGALMALKDAKKHTSRNGVVYNEELQQNVDMRKNIEINMMHALSKEEFSVYVQPQITLKDDSCIRGETLIRWNSEFMGFLSPDQFIPVFESNGFIVETDFFMLSTAMECLSQRQAAGQKPFTFAVNQSKVTITFPNYFERLKALISQYPDIPLRFIELEITESAMETNWGILVPLIHGLKKLGFSVAMDDFGSGYSSLNTLRIMPIDILKIDREFLKEAEHSERCRIIIRSVIDLAKHLKIFLVCEGIETEHQVKFLKESGCDIGQGFFYARPMPIEDFLEKYGQ